MINHMNNRHTVKAFDDDMKELRGLISEMGARSEKAIGFAIEALEQGNLELAAEVVENDRLIDALEKKVDRLVIQTIALRAPMADDLRMLVSALKIAGVVERIGDHAKNIARRVPLILSENPVEALAKMPVLSRATRALLDDAFTAFATEDDELALSVCSRDKAIDDHYYTVFRDILHYMGEHPEHVNSCTHLLFMAKNLERIGDQATNISEMVYFVVTGKNSKDRERGISPLDDFDTDV